MSENMSPDFTKYTYFELLDALESIDRIAYPDRVKLIEQELELIRYKFPFLGIPTDGFRVNDETESIWKKMKEALCEDKPLKIYGNIEAEVSENNAGKFHTSSVSAYMVEEYGSLNLVLRGQYQDTLNVDSGGGVARLKINASNLNRLKDLLEEVESDLIRKDLTSTSR